MRQRRGAVLLEAIVALTILTTAGVAAVSLTATASRTAERARSVEQRLQRASAFLDAVALWPREDLDRRLGDRAQGPWRLRIDRPLPALYVLGLRDSTGGTLVTTTVYRPETETRAAR
jgi:type II secretory pathway pseudopilin PulG